MEAGGVGNRRKKVAIASHVVSCEEQGEKQRERERESVCVCGNRVGIEQKQSDSVGGTIRP